MVVANTLPLAAGACAVRLLRTSDNATSSLGNATLAALNVKLDSRNPVFTPSLTPVPVPAAFTKVLRQGGGSLRLEFTATGVASPKIYASRTMAAGT